MQFNYLSAIRGVLVRDAGKAIEMLATAAPYELAETGETVNFVLYPVYFRSDAYLAAKQGAAAAAEFHKIIDDPASLGTSPSAHSRIWDLPEPMSSPATPPKRRPPTKASLRSGKTPTPTSPFLREAKAEYAKLQ